MSFDRQKLADNLAKHIGMVDDNKANWPADMNAASGLVTQHVLMACPKLRAISNIPPRVLCQRRPNQRPTRVTRRPASKEFALADARLTSRVRFLLLASPVLDSAARLGSKGRKSPTGLRCSAQASSAMPSCSASIVISASVPAARRLLRLGNVRR